MQQPWMTKILSEQSESQEKIFEPITHKLGDRIDEWVLLEKYLIGLWPSVKKN